MWENDQSYIKTLLKDLRGLIGCLVSSKITTFVRDESYAPNNTAEFFTEEVLDRWNKLMPGKHPDPRPHRKVLFR